MDRASSFAYPGGRTLAHWQRQLAPLHPQTLWVGHWFVHRVEALAQAEQRVPLENFTSLLLQACSLEGADVVAVPAVARRLGVPAPLAAGWLRDLAKRGLVHANADESFRWTSQGRDALRLGFTDRKRESRQTFSFLERLEADGVRRAEPHFLALAETTAIPWLNSEPHRFDPHWLPKCAHQTGEWKKSFGFPGDVVGFSHENGSLEAGQPDWRKVFLDRTERIPVLLFQEGRSTTPIWRAYAWQAIGWTLHDQTPIWTGGQEIAQIFPELMKPPRLQEWRAVWLQWCRQRSLPSQEAEGTELAWVDGHLVAKAPPRMVHRLQAGNSDLCKGEAWLLTGDGYLRPAAPLVLGTL